MFLDITKKRNPQLIEAAVALHQSGQILPDTYVMDMDMIEANANAMLKTAAAYDMELFYMTKQIGRNPYIAQRLHDVGMKKAVVVDFKEAQVMMEHGLPLGNTGHLVQIPMHLLERIIAYGSDYITIYSLEMLQAVNRVAAKLGKRQAVLLRIVNDEQDRLYPGQYGGFLIDELSNYLDAFKACTSVDIAGITSFPCFLYDEQANEINQTHNVITVQTAKAILQDTGFSIRELNIPSATCSRSIPFIASIGGTQGEPGHALTGTTPMHAVEDLAEKPAMVYVSEVSHTFKGQSYVYGGGYYRRGHLQHVLLDNRGEQQIATMAPFADENIDYYLEVNGDHDFGATAIMAFRTQIFVTRSTIAIVEGISKGEPKLVGLYNSLGQKID